MTDASNTGRTSQDQRSDARLPTVHVATVIGMALVTFALAIGLHELGHAAAAWSVGGDPAIVSSTDMRGDLSALDRWGYLWTGAAGSLVNWVLAGLGLRSALRAKRNETRVAAWIFAAVNGLIPSVYMVASPLMGFGDWATVISQFENRWLVRLAVGAIGVGLAAWWVRRVGPLLERHLAALPRADREAAAITLTRTVWLAGGGLGLAAALSSPLGPLWAIPIGVGSTIGTTWPLLPMGRVAGGRALAAPEPHAATVLVPRSSWWVLVGGGAGLAFAWFFGRGIPL